MEDDLKHIQQGSRTVMEYQREFVKLVNCVPFVIWDEAHKAQLFLDGLRSNIFQVVQAADLHTFSASGRSRHHSGTGLRSHSKPTRELRARSRTEAFPTHFGRGSSGGSRPPKYSKPQRRNRNTSAGGQKQWHRPCVICSKNHREMESP